MNFTKSVLVLGFVFGSVTSRAQVTQPNLQDATAVTDGTPGTPTPQMPGINEAAMAAAAAQKAAAMQNMIAGTALMAAGIAGCQGTQTWGCPLIPMAALAFMQAGHDSNMAGLSDQTYDASKQSPTLSGGGGTNPDTPTTPTDTGFTKKVKEGLDQAADLGVTVDPASGTVKTPEGTFPASAFSSPAAMADAGISPASIAAANKALADAGAGGASVGSMGFETAGGSGGSGGYGGGGSGSALDDYFSNLNKGKKGDKDRMIAGKSLNYGSDPIGVKQDNIFMMVHRRYQGKRKVNSYFLERMPASTKPATGKIGKL